MMLHAEREEHPRVDSRLLADQRLERLSPALARALPQPLDQIERREVSRVVRHEPLEDRAGLAQAPNAVCDGVPRARAQGGLEYGELLVMEHVESVDLLEER